MKGNNIEETKIPVKDKDKKRIILIVSVIAVIAVLLGISFFANADERKLKEQLDLGAKYIDELKYEEALACYMSAVEIDPMSVDAYLGIVEVYIRTGEYDSALEWAQKGYDLTGDERLKEKIDMIESEIARRKEKDKKEAEQSEPSFHGTKLTAYDESGNVAWYHIKSYGPDRIPSNVTAYNASEQEIGSVPLIYYDDGDWEHGRTIEQQTSYGYDEEDGHIWLVELVHEMIYIEPPVEETASDEENNGESNEFGEDMNEAMPFDYAESMQTQKSVLTRVNRYEDTTGSVLAAYELYEYDSNGWNIRQEEYKADGTLERYDVLENDEKGRLIRVDRYVGGGDDSQLEEYQIYERDNGGRMTGLKTYNADGTLKESTDYMEDGTKKTYDGNGTVIEYTVKEENMTYTYDGDDNLLYTEETRS